MEISIKWNDKPNIRFKIFKAKTKTNKVIVIAHGLLATSGGPYSKTRFLGKKIFEKEVGNVV